ncbi:MAG: hypothetical protein WA946_14690 [Nitrospirota bacterium]
MSDQNLNHAVLHLSERESAQLARAVQILIQELGFDQEEVDRSYNESLAFFLKNEHYDQRLSGDASFIGQMSTTA